MTARSKLITGLAGGLAVLATAGLIVSSVLSSYSELCEVCITFDGRTACREAYGKTQEDAVRTATDNACGIISRGMTDSIRCANTQPTRVTCQR